MRFLILLIFCLSILRLPAQDTTGSNPSAVPPIDSLTASRVALESASIRMDSIDRAASMEQMSRNMESFVRMQKEREAKQQRNAMIRIGIGVLFLIVFIVGVMRRRKK